MNHALRRKAQRRGRNCLLYLPPPGPAHFKIFQERSSGLSPHICGPPFCSQCLTDCRLPSLSGPCLGDVGVALELTAQAQLLQAPKLLCQPSTPAAIVFSKQCQT
jgi:hypothetical protein